MTKPFFPQLPLGDCDQPIHPDYLRLFGSTSPDQVITLLPQDPAAGQTSASLPALHCDPNAGGEAVFSRSIHDIAALRARHLANGHTPATDAEHGYLFFWHGAQDFARDAFKARDPSRRRNKLISAIGMMVALVDCEDFLTQQEPPR